MKTNLIHTFIAIAFAILCQPLVAQNVTTPRPESGGHGFSNGRYFYCNRQIFQAGSKGTRSLGRLVPYGWNVEAFGTKNEAPWRSGANENTIIELPIMLRFRVRKFLLVHTGYFL